MAKRKIVIQVTMPDARSRSRATVLAAKANGVISIGVTGDLKDRLEVVGDGIDITGLVKRLRKKLRHAEVLRSEGQEENGGALGVPGAEPVRQLLPHADADAHDGSLRRGAAGRPILPHLMKLVK